MGVEINKEGLTTAIINIVLLTSIILLVSYFSVNNKLIIGPVLIILGLITLAPVLLFKIPITILKGDILFGMIDNGILAFFALFGAELFGILGAIVGGLVGNSVTDGLAGVFEGYEWQKVKQLKIKDKRTALTVSIGKLTGCLFGAGIILTLIWSIGSLF